MSLRTKLFIASAFLSTTILLIAAWVINSVVVKQARQQVQSEVENLLPVYNAVLEDSARSLASIGVTMANSQITKTVFGDPRAARDRATIRQVIADLSSETTAPIDLILISDGAGKITFAELNNHESITLTDLPAAKNVASTQKQEQGFAVLGDNLYQLVLTPILVQSGNDEFQNTLAILGTGAQINRAFAEKLHKQMHSEVAFLSAGQVRASSFAQGDETDLVKLANAPEIQQADATKPVEVKIQNRLSLAFSRALTSFENQNVGRVIVFRSLEETSKLFRTIYNVLFLLWSLSIAATFLISYLLAERITRPIESLMQGTREVGSGNYDHEIKAESHGELGELANAFDQMRRSLRQTQMELLKRERLAAVGQMASSIVHDLRNPLATISTAAEMLSRDGLALDRRQTLLDSQMRASHRMQEMLTEMLDFTRGSYTLDLEHYPLRQIAERAVQSLNIARSGVKIIWEIPSDLYVTVDGERLRRVFENLINNAMQALPKDASARTIILRAVAQSNQMRVDVIDNGVGVPREIQDRLFEPFVSHGKLGGTGLGLAIARSIVIAHGGNIALENTDGQGSDFYFTLPRDETEIAPKFQD